MSIEQQQKIQPLIAQRFSLTEARRGRELLEKGGVIGKIVLMPMGHRFNQEQRNIGMPR